MSGGCKWERSRYQQCCDDFELLFLFIFFFFGGGGGYVDAICRGGSTNFGMGAGPPMRTPKARMKRGFFAPKVRKNENLSAK